MKYANILKNRVKNVTKLPDDIRNLTYDDQLASLRKRADRLEEIFQIADNIAVIAHGRVSPICKTEDTTPEQIGLWMSGLFEEKQATAPANAV